MTTTLALFGPIGTWEAIVLLALGLLIFGRRLPEVGKSLGKGIVEFRKGLAGIEQEVHEASQRQQQAPPPQPQPTYVAPAQPANLPSGDRVAQTRQPIVGEPAATESH
jgi:sec-independent protein translocase protein TatA